LVKKNREQWLEGIREEMPVAPINFARIKKLNVKGFSAPTEQVLNANPWIIDIRSPEAFAKSHLKGALNMPFGPSFCNWAGSFLADDYPLIIVGQNEAHMRATVINLHLIGFDNIMGLEMWDENLVQRYVFDSLPTITAATLQEILQHRKDSCYVLDVRTAAEWNAIHIEEAQHFELSRLGYALPQLPKDKPIYVMCGSGIRASLAASYLIKMGYPQAYNEQGGMSAWNRLERLRT
jgi:hydroxyacylglutathione hydrolase